MARTAVMPGGKPFHERCAVGSIAHVKPQGAPWDSDSAGKPRRDLLDEPRIAVGVVEGEERPVARALRVRAAEPCLQGKRRPVPHLTRFDPAAGKFGMSRF